VCVTAPDGDDAGDSFAVLEIAVGRGAGGARAKRARAIVLIGGETAHTCSRGSAIRGS
jgi:hypothetical protein